MSLLIKGMEMPKNCLECEATATDYWGKYCTFTGIDCLNIGRQKNCPLVEMPPHGRLIDADALLESIKEARKKDPDVEDVYIDDYFTVAEWVVSAPAIIESEET